MAALANNTSTALLAGLDLPSGGCSSGGCSTVNRGAVVMEVDGRGQQPMQLEDDGDRPMQVDNGMGGLSNQLLTELLS